MRVVQSIEIKPLRSVQFARLRSLWMPMPPKRSLQVDKPVKIGLRSCTNSSLEVDLRVRAPALA